MGDSPSYVLAANILQIFLVLLICSYEVTRPQIYEPAYHITHEVIEERAILGESR